MQVGGGMRGFSRRDERVQGYERNSSIKRVVRGLRGTGEGMSTIGAWGEMFVSG